MSSLFDDLKEGLEEAIAHENGSKMAKERTYMTGSPMAEVLRGNLDKIQASDVLERMGL